MVVGIKEVKVVFLAMVEKVREVILVKEARCNTGIGINVNIYV